MSRDDYIRLAGLLVIGQDLEKQQRLVIRNVVALIGETDEDGHAADAIYSGYTVDELLRKSEITVAADEPSADATEPKAPSENTHLPAARG